MNRKEFVSSSLLACAALATGGITLSSCQSSSKKRVDIKSNSTILFQGDSITDASRNFDNEAMVNDRSMLGYGYPLFASARILCDYADKGVKIYNRGISGNKIPQLMDRWDKDCIALKPDVVTILIGVNDFWHTLNGKYEGDAASFEEGYRKLLTYTKKQLPNTRIVICEPFVITGGKAVGDYKWVSEFPKYQAVARKMADEFSLTFIPYQEIFNKALEVAEYSTWSNDGVHPSMMGAQLMADAWVEYTMPQLAK